jgi:hypothetical protein
MRGIASPLAAGVVFCSTLFLVGCTRSAEQHDAGAAAAPAAEVSAVATTAAPGPHVVRVVAKDYTFEAPDILPAGYTTFDLVDRGAEPHHIWLVRLEEGKTVDDLMRAVQANPMEMPAWAVSIGGPNTPMPGGETNATVLLEPGSYAMVCVIPAPDGVPHVAKGMVHPLTVVPATGEPTTEPAADVTLTMNDYDFQLSKPITAGRHTVRVVNAGPQEHEVIVVKLAPGKTVKDAEAWIVNPQGPPPGEFFGGTTGMARGIHNDVTIDFTPGEYALLCMVPDAKDGKPHIAHGMAKQIRVS